jgi:hypothetical protein
MRCPKCQSWQSLKAAFWGNPQAWAGVLFLPVLLIPLFMLNPLFRRGANFDSYRDQIEVVESRLQVDDGSPYNSVVTIGRLKNNSPEKWSHVVLEVQYFDDKGVLIGAKSAEDFAMVLLPGGEHAFQIECNRVRPAKDYASQKIFVQNARDASKWP